MLVILLILTLFAKATSIEDLKHQLDSANTELALAQERVLELRYMIAIKEINRIENLVERSKERSELKKRPPKPEYLSFLTQQREILANIINTIPSCANRAQDVHDTILAYLTELTDQYDVAF